MQGDARIPLRAGVERVQQLDGFAESEGRGKHEVSTNALDGQLDAGIEIIEQRRHGALGLIHGGALLAAVHGP